jgi:gliding motility-associated protein GldM
MASGKASPRQKMINMMYLVLTALLALNVSESILESFENISESLNQAAKRFQSKNSALGGDIKNTIQKEAETGSKKNVIYLTEIDGILSETEKLNGFLNGLIKEMFKEEIAGVSEHNNTRVKSRGEQEKNYRYFMVGEGKETDNDGRGSGQARILRQKLNAYVDWANALYMRLNKGKRHNGGKGFEHLAIDPKDDPLVTNPETKEYKWEYVTFHGAPVVANIAVIEKYKNDIRVIESDLLELVKGRLNNIVFKIDSLIPIDAPISAVVAAGLPFETKLYVAMSSREIKPSFEGPGITIDPSGFSAKMKITANRGVVPAGRREGEQAYSATIRVPKADGTTAVLPVRGKFTVVLPTIKVSSGAIQNMYLECGNVIEVDVPELGQYYDPVITSEQAQVAVSPQNKKQVMVVPRGGKSTTIKVATRTGGQVYPVGEVVYTNILPPKPTIRVKYGNRELKAGEAVAKSGTLTLEVVPDGNFKSALPKDARYVLKGIKVKAKIGLGAPVELSSLPASRLRNDGSNIGFVDVNLRDALSGVYKPGMTLFISIDQVNRTNFQDKAIPENRISESERYISVNVQ